MPTYPIGGLHDPRDDYWLGYRLYDALAPHVDKIRRNFLNNAGGWEAWAQFEIMHELTLATEAAANQLRYSGLYNSVSSTFLREEDYTHYDLRSDFQIEVEVDGEPSELHLVELKCRSSKETNAAFVGRVRQDLVKVSNEELEGSEIAGAVSAWAIAISVAEPDADLDQRMYQLAAERHIQWHVIELPRNGGLAVKIWAYENRIKGVNSQILFTYAVQSALGQINRYGDVRRPEPVINMDEFHMDE